MKWQPLILQWTVKSVHVRCGQWGVRGVQGSSGGGSTERGEWENSTGEAPRKRTASFLPVRRRHRERARESKPLWKKGPNKALPFWCRAAMPALTRSSSLPILARAEGARQCQLQKLHQTCIHMLYLQISTAFLPLLFVSSLPAAPAALLEALLLYTNFILDLDELKPRTSHFPLLPTDF